MSDFERVLSDARWTEHRAARRSATRGQTVNLDGVKNPLQLIALTNDVLEDSEPRKITRARLDAMRESAQALLQSYRLAHGAEREAWLPAQQVLAAQADEALEFADALESYLER